MQIQDRDSGIVVDLDFDGDGFPIVNVMIDGGSFEDENGRKTVEVQVNGEVVHSMFATESDNG